MFRVDYLVVRGPGDAPTTFDDPDNTMSFAAECVIGCDHSGLFFVGTGIEELNMNLFVQPLLGLRPVPPGYPEIGPFGTAYFYVGPRSVDAGKVTFDPGDGSTPVSFDWIFEVGQTFDVDFVVNTTVPGVRHPSITMVGDGNMVWRDGFGSRRSLGR